MDLKTRIELVLSEILSDKYDRKVSLRFIEKGEEHEQHHSNSEPQRRGSCTA